MTATVTDITSRLGRDPAPTCNCYPHQLYALTERIRAALDSTAGELLITRGEYDAALVDVLTTVDAITAETLPDDERNTR